MFDGEFAILAHLLRKKCRFPISWFFDVEFLSREKDDGIKGMGGFNSRHV